jgi:hypothetical protein
MTSIDAFFNRWSHLEGGAERANDAMFLSELCDVIGGPRPDPAGAMSERNDYVFQRLARRTEGIPSGSISIARGMVLLSPYSVRARLAARAPDWRWSSVRAHLDGVGDGLVTVAPVLSRIDNFAALVEGDADGSGDDALRKAELTGRPVGTAPFISDLERRLGRPVARRAPGRKPAQRPTEHPSLF